MALPRKRPRVKAYQPAAQQVKFARRNPVTPRAAATPAPVMQAPPPPKLEAVPTPTAVAPPQTLQSTTDRNQARYDYGVAQGDVNSQLRELASQYGGAPQVTQFGYADNGQGKYADAQSAAAITPNAPGSTLEVLKRNLAAQQQNVDETANADNTFFSGRRVSLLDKNQQGYQGDMANAQRTYNSAVDRLVTALMQARGQRNQNLSAADIADIQAAAGTTPEAQAPDPNAPIDWAAVQAAFGGTPGGAGAGGPATPGEVPHLSAGGQTAQPTSGGRRRARRRRR